VIARLTPMLSASTLLTVEDATIEASRFDAEKLPGPMPAILLRSESASSSQIENITVGPKNLALAAIGVESSRNAELVAANARAMRLATTDAPITLDAILAMHRTLLAGTDPRAGQLRTEQVWIGTGQSISPLEADFVPPHHTRVPAALQDLAEFAGRTDLSIIIQAAIVHAQFETIHPFTDGNGRTGRVLIHSIFRGRGLLASTTAPVSAAILADTPGYFRALAAYRDGDIDPIVQVIARGTSAGVAWGRDLAARIAAIRMRWEREIPGRQGTTARRLADHLITQPTVTTNYLVEALAIPERSAREAIATLETAGILTPLRVGRRRNQVWQAPDILAALQDFADRSARRRPA
jgi:Fic family protein